MFSSIQIAGTGNGHGLGHGVEASLGLEFLPKCLTTGFQQGYIRLAVVDHFLMEIERHVSTNLVTMPTEQFFFPLGHHPVRIVKFQIGDPIHVHVGYRGC